VKQLRASSLPKKHVEVDVVVIGSGIIGLLTTKALLQESLSVALIEKKQLCAGATGAGQGYLWMAHRSPSTAAWDLAAWSMREWKHTIGKNPELSRNTEWQANGSLLLATSASESEQLRSRQEMLASHGITARYLRGEEVLGLEPALRLPCPTSEGGGLVAEADAQINGRLTAHTLLASCQRFPGLHLMMDEPVEVLHAGPASAPVVETASTIIEPRLGACVTAGVWSGELLSQATGHPGWAKLLQPRRGHLLELRPPAGMPAIKHGVMEMSYTKHYSASSGHGTAAAAAAAAAPASDPVDITFTVTTSASGTLLLGSSREFSGWGNDASTSIVQAIMGRAAQFLPQLADHPLPTGPDVRVGLRPYATGGLPMVGPVPGCSGLYVAAGHEGSGLCLGPATAHLLKHHLLQGGDTLQAAGVSTPLSHFKDLLPEERVKQVA